VKEVLQEFLNRRLPLPGVAAWCARLADRTLLSGCYTDWFSEKQLEQTLTRMALAADGLGYHGIQPVRLCWVFEHTRIHLALHRDGLCLALYLENRPGLPSSELDEVLDEFTRLTTP
jgi:hypothetical protein